VLSSGRLTGPIRFGNGKKRTTVRKISTTSVDSGYSLCSTDSEDQVLVINKGLDRCAALLQDILHSDVKGSAQHHSSRAPIHRVNVRSSALRGKRTVPKKPGTASHVHKEIASVRKTKTSAGFDGETNPYSLNVQPRGLSATPHSLVTQPAVFDNLQTQMSLMDEPARQTNYQNIPAVPLQSVPESGVGGATLFNCRLPSSTPALSPQRPGNTLNVGTEQYNPVPPQGGAPHIPSGSFPAAQSVPTVMCYVPTPVQQISGAPVCYQPAFQTGTVPQTNNPEKMRESDLLQCIAAHLAQLQRTEASNTQNHTHVPSVVHESDQDGPARETDETSSEEEETIPVKGISCQTSFDTNRRFNPVNTEEKINTVKSLLGVIKSLAAQQGSSEAFRLITELEHSLSLLPAVVGSTNVHAEIALALQPIRSENAQLRRRLRILNQQLRDRERAEKSARPDDQDFEMNSLRSMNATLQHQLTESQKSLDSWRTKNEELIKLIDFHREENTKLGQLIQGKEQEVTKLRLQGDQSACKDLEETLEKMRSFQFKLEASEKENQILGITLRQRDVEVSRLRELTRTLQGSMAKLLCDINKDDKRSTSVNGLTKSALESYEQQLRGDQSLAGTSVMSYLKTLETDQVIPSPDMVFSGNKCPVSDFGENTTNKRPEKQDPYQLSDSARTVLFNSSPDKRNKSRPESESTVTVCEGYRPEETLYLPLTSSPHKSHFASSHKPVCTPPRADQAPAACS
ncbi:hypothetical protein GDO86_016673, partial [Hymenochirus boettgeri]